MNHNLRFATIVLAMLWAGTETAFAQPPAPTPPAPTPPAPAPTPPVEDADKPGDAPPGDSVAPPADDTTPPADGTTPADAADTPPDNGDSAPVDTPPDDSDSAPVDTADTIPADSLPADDVPEAETEIIVITGSRIATDPLNNPAPVTQLNSEDIARTGLTSVADLLQRLPVSGGALNTKFNSSGNFGFPPDGGGIGAGSAQADLRYLGAKRVLVLVDGVRWVNGSSGSGVPAATDLNTIPIGIVERIEVLQDGASPIYGSDAIGGVINIITKKNWEGGQANAYLGGFNEGDGFTQQYDATWGQKNERMSMIMSTSFVEQRRVAANDRSISRYPVAGFGACTPNCSSGTPQGRFVLTDPNTGQDLNLTINDGVSGIPYYDPLNPGMGDDFHGFETADRFNYSPYNLVMTPSRRFGVFSGVRYKLNDWVSINGRALFNNRVSVNQAAPEPIFIGPEAGNGNRMDRISIDVTNPYNPFGFTIDAATNPYFIGRRPIEAGPRIFEQNVNTVYVAGGLDGTFKLGDRRFSWDATAAYGLNRADQIKNGGFNSAKLEKALGPLADCDADPDCVPFNIFGGQAGGSGTITREMLDYVTFVQKDVSGQELVDLTANVSGGLIKLPAGALSFAAGVEHRQQEGFFQPDAVVVAGDTAGVPSSPTKGEFKANEAYAEILVPVLKKAKGADLLDLSAAVRLSDYSTFGAQSTLKGGVRWRPNKDLLVRGSYGQGFRAPGIGELFGSKARFDQTLTDPCSDMLGLNGGTAAPQSVVDNCIALGVPADGSYEQFNQQISVTTGGNRELEPENSDSLTASLVYSPSWLVQRSPWIEQLNFELTYFRIELAGAIQAIDAQVQLDQCVGDPNSSLCDGISRTPTGVINGFGNQLQNIGGIDTDGLDLTMSYLGPKMNLGRLRVTSLSNVLLHFTQSIPASGGFEKISREGTEVGDPEQAYPKFKSTLILDWYRGDWRASLTTRYINAVTEPCRGFINALGVCSAANEMDESLGENHIGAMVYNDVQATWTPRSLDSRFELTAGVNNLFNREPPKCYSCALNGFDATTYDVPGMFGYVKAGYRMW